MSVTNVVPDEVRSLMGSLKSVHMKTGSGERIVTPKKQLDPVMKEKIERILQQLLSSRAFSNYFTNLRGRFNIIWKSKEGKTVVIIAGKEIELNENGDPILPKEEDPEKKEESLLKDIQDQAEKVSVGVDLLSGIRNTLSAIGKTALQFAHSPVSVAVNSLGILGGVFGIGGGGILASKGVSQIVNSKESEEVHLGALKTIAGTSYMGVGISSIIFRASSLVSSASGVASTTLTFALNPLAGAMNAVFLLLGIYQMAITGSFRSDLNKAEEKGLKEGIQFLYESLFVLTAEEQVKVNQSADPVKEKATILQCKLEHMQRRTGSGVNEELRNQIKELKEKFDAGNPDSETMVQAQRVIETVSKENFKTIVKTAMFILLAVAGIAAVVAMGPAGTFAFAAAVAIGWLILDATRTSDFTAEMFWNLRQLIVGLFVVTNEGVDQGFKNYLDGLYPDLKLKEEVYLLARTDMFGSYYNLFLKLEGEDPKTKKTRDHFRQMMEEIRTANVADLSSDEEFADYLCSAMPQFYAYIANGRDHDAVDKDLKEWREACLATYEEMKGLPKAEQLKCTVMHFLSAQYDSEENLRDAHSSLSQKLRGNSESAQGFFDLGSDSSFMSLKDQDKMLTFIQENYPKFWNAIQVGFSEEKFKYMIENGFSGCDALWAAWTPQELSKKMRQLTSGRFQKMTREILTAPLPPPALKSSKEVAGYLKSSMPEFYGFLTKKIPAEEAEEKVGEALMQARKEWLEQFPEMEFLCPGAQIKPVVHYWLNSLYDNASTIEVAFGSLTSDEKEALAKNEMNGLPLMQLGCALQEAFGMLERSKTALETIRYSELLLSKDEAKILSRHREYVNKASKQYPAFFEQAMRSPVSYKKSIQKDLESVIASRKSKEINGKSILLPEMTITDFQRSHRAEIFDGDKLLLGAEGGEQGGTLVVEQFLDIANGDELLFLMLAALYSQTPKNYVTSFQAPLRKMGVQTGLYIPEFHMAKQVFIRKEDGSFEMQNHFNFTLTPGAGEGEALDLPTIATFRLAKQNGEWICTGPEYSDMIQPDGDQGRAI